MVLRGRGDIQVRPARPDRWVRLVPLARLDLLDLRVRRDWSARLVLRDSREIRDRKGLRVFRASRVRRATLVQSVQLDRWVRKVSRGIRDRRVLRVSLVVPPIRCTSSGTQLR